MTVIALGAGYAETCKSGSGGGSAETADESQYGAAVPTSHKLPSDIVPISIALKPPSWYKGLEYKKLAPSFDILKRWKQSHNTAEYIRWFERRVLANLDAGQVFQELSSMAKDKEVVLICYERVDDFCHRHLVADWFRNNGYACKEIIL